MANEPYFYGKNWRVGPFTFTDAQRAAADQKWQELQAMQAAPVAVAPPPAASVPNAGNLNPAQVYPPQVGQPLTRDQALSGSDMVFGDRSTGGMPAPQEAPTPLPTISTAPSEGPSLSGYFNSFMDWLNKGDPDPQAQTALPDTAPIPTERPTDTPVDPAAAPAAEPSIEDQMAKYRAMVDTLYPPMDVSETASSAQAREFANNEMKRSKLMAQLALSAGIVGAAGYPELAKGMIAAGGAYDEGFKRYHKALQDAGEEEMQRRRLQYADKTNRNDAALKLYLDDSKTARDALKQQREEAFKWFGLEKPGEAAMQADPEAWNDYQRRLGLYRATGEYVPYIPPENDVRAK